MVHLLLWQNKQQVLQEQGVPEGVCTHCIVFAKP